MTLLTFVLFLVVTAVLTFVGQTISLQSIKENFKEIPTPDILDGFRRLIIKADIEPANENIKNSVKYSVISLISLIVVYVLLY